MSEQDKDPQQNSSTNAAKKNEPEAEATSSETLSKIEETEKVSDAGGSSGTEESSSVPSPDGIFGERIGDAGKDNPGPM